MCEKVQVGSQTMRTSNPDGVTIGEFVDDVSDIVALNWLLHRNVSDACVRSTAATSPSDALGAGIWVPKR